MTVLTHVMAFMIGGIVGITALAPFCGGEAETLTAESMHGGYLFGIMCSDCRSRGDVYTTEAEAIAAWNTRVDYHGYEQAAIEAWESIKAWNSRAERTCECVAEYAESPIDGKKIVLHRCSACHELMRPHMRYCPNCGARRVGE